MIMNNFFSITNKYIDDKKLKTIRILGKEIVIDCSNYYKYRKFYLPTAIGMYSFLTSKQGDERVEKITPKPLLFFEKFGYKFFENYLLLRYMFTKKVSLFFYEHKLITKCTLRCKDCCHYIPFFKNNQKITLEQFKQDLDLLLKTVDVIYGMSLTGGETLLAKDLTKMIKYALSKKRVKNIIITTNSTIIPSEELIDILKHNRKRCFVVISNYTKNEKLDKIINFEKVKKIFKDNNIPCSCTRKDTIWTQKPIILEPKLAKDNNTNTRDCWLSGCKTYINNTMFLCPIQYYMTQDFDKYPIPEGECVHLDQNDIETRNTNLLNFFIKGKFEFCNYCEIHPEIQVDVADQLAKV